MAHEESLMKSNLQSQCLLDGGEIDAPVICAGSIEGPIVESRRALSINGTSNASQNKTWSCSGSAWPELEVIQANVAGRLIRMQYDR